MCQIENFDTSWPNEQISRYFPTPRSLSSKSFWPKYYLGHTKETEGNEPTSNKVTYRKAIKRSRGLQANLDIR